MDHSVASGALAAAPFRRLKAPAFWLVILALAATALTWFLNLHGRWEPPYLNLVLQLTLVTATSLIVAALAVRSFRSTGSWPVLWLGAGSLAFGMVNALSNALLQWVNVNAAVTSNNLGVLLAATLYFLGAFFVYNEVAPRETNSGRLATVLQVYLGSLVIVVLIAVAALQGLLPPFFIQGQGGTPWRQLVVAGAGLLFLFAGLTFLNQYRRSKADFLYWYGLGLLLVALVLAGTLLTTATGTPLSWLVRTEQLLSGLCLLAAVLVTLGKARATGQPAEEVLAGFLWRDRANLKRLFESIMDAIIVTDQHFIITDWNRAAEEVYGWKAAEVLGKPAAGVLHTSYPPGVDREATQKLLLSAGTWRGEVVQRHRDGREMPVLATVSVLRDAIGGVVGAVAVNRDITERVRIEDQLRQSEEQTRDLIRYAPTGIYEVDFRTGRFRSVNDAMCEILGYTRAELLAMTAFDLLDDAGKFLFGDRIRRTLAGEKVDPSVEYRVIKKDGTPIDALLSIRITTRDGHPDGAFVIAHDVTERLRAAEELRLAAERLEQRVQERTAELESANEALRYQASVLENVNDAIVAYDAADLHVTLWNHRAEEQYGWTADEALGAYAPTVVGSLLEPEQRAEIVQTVAETGRWRGELRHTRRDGTRIVVETSSTALRDDSGRVVAHVTANRDITEGKRLEEALRESEQRYRLLYENSADAIFLTATDGSIQFANPAACHMLGLTEEAIRALGRDRLADPNDTRWAAAVAQRELTGCFLGELNFVRGDGSSFPGEVSSNVFLDKDGRRRTTTIVRDITERKRMEQDLTASRAQLQNLAHRLVDLQESERSQLAQQLYNDEGQRLAALILGLGRAKKDAGCAPALASNLDDLQSLADGVLADMHNLAVDLRPASLDRLGLGPALGQLILDFARECGIGSTADLSGLQGLRLPPKTETCVYRIMQSALENIAQHAQARHVSVTAVPYEGQVSIMVEDDGVGFDLEEARRQGGLGLLSMHERAEAVGGSLTIESAPGKGTALYIKVPQA